MAATTKAGPKLSRGVLTIIIVVAVLVAAVGGGYLASVIFAKPSETIRIGVQPALGHIEPILAQKKGWWAEAGINVSITYFPGGGPPEMLAFKRGDLDVAYVGTGPAALNIGQGVDAKVVAGAVGPEYIDLIVKTDLDYTGPSSLKGKTIATLPAGSIQHTAFTRWLGLNNLTTSDVTIRPMGVEMVTFLSNKTVDGIVFGGEWKSMIELQGFGKTVVTSNEMWPGAQSNILLVSGKLIREKPEIVKKIVDIHIKATNYILTHRNETATVTKDSFIQYFPTFTPTFYEDVIRETIKTYNFEVNPRNAVSSMLAYAQVYRQLGASTKDLTEADIFDYRFYDQVTGG